MYQFVVGLRNWLYDHSLLRAKRIDCKVISIGNLTLGGTGKTPLTLTLLQELRDRGHTCGVVSRGYKREGAGVLEVDLADKAAQRFGDEPALIKATFPDVPVVVGERRVAAAKALMALRKVDVLLCDDAFQHRRLHRDLNLLCLDASEPPKNYRMMPVGRARESLVPALRRADFLVVTKTNLVAPAQLAAVIDWLESKTTKPTLLADYVFKGLRSMNGQSVQTLSDGVYLVSAIAKPAALEKTLAGRVRVVKHRTFRDHHRYANREVEEILDEASHLQARWVLTTAKDSMKLSAFPRLRERLWVVELGLEFRGDVKAFYEAVDRLAQSNP